MRRVVLALFLFLIAVQAQAATYYVATTGSNTNPGSESQPFQTVDKGVSVLGAGDTLYIRQGTYTNQLISAFPSGTSWQNPVTIAGYPGETVTLFGKNAGFNLGAPAAYIIFDNLILDVDGGGGAILIGSDTHHIRFQNGELTNAYPTGETSPGVAEAGNLVQGNGSNLEVLNSKIHKANSYGFYWGGRDSLFDGNELYNLNGFSYHIYSSGSNTVSNNIVRNNIIHNNGHGPALAGWNIFGGMIVSHGAGNKVYNNVIYGNYAGIQVDYECIDCEIYNNTIYGSAETAGIYIGSTAVNTIVKNNLLSGNRFSGIDNQGDAGAVLASNWTEADGDPQFVNAGANDFHLQATSGAINAGVTLTEFSTDIAGIVRPQGPAWDIGAYERVASGTPVATSLAFGVHPTNTTVNGTITPAVTVRVLDQFGALVSSTASITLTLNTCTGLSGTNPKNAVAGTATFSNLQVSTAGSNCTLTASSSGLTSATSNAFTIQAPTPTGFPGTVAPVPGFAFVNTAFPLNRQQALTRDLIGAWMELPKINESGTRVLDISGRNNHCTLTNMAVPGTPSSGRGRTARPSGYGEQRTDGLDDYVHCGIIPQLTGAAQATLSGWMKRESTGDGMGFGVEGNSPQENRFFIWQFPVGPGYLYAIVDDGATSAYGQLTPFSSVEWNHFALVYNGTLAGAARISLYINGVAQALTAEGGGLPPATLPNNALFGHGRVWTSGTLRYLHGRADGVFLRTRALTAKEIQDEYSASKQGYMTSILAQWQLQAPRNQSLNQALKGFFQFLR